MIAKGLTNIPATGMFKRGGTSVYNIINIKLESEKLYLEGATISDVTKDKFIVTAVEDTVVAVD